MNSSLPSYRPLPGWPDSAPRKPEYAERLDSDALPLISVVCPSFQQGEFIEEMILSVVFQNYPRTELIIMDGGSTDATIEILDRYANVISYCVSEPDNGQSHALNKGFAVSKGDIVGWQNADDLYLPNALWRVAAQASRVQNVSEFALIGHVDIVEGGEVIGRKYFTSFSCNSLIYRGINFATQSLFLSKKVVKQHQIDESLHYAMDGEYLLRLAESGVDIRLVNSTLGAFRRQPDGKTIANSNASRSEWLDVLEKRGVDLRFAGLKRQFYTVQRVGGLAKSGVLFQSLFRKYIRPGG